MNKKKKRKYDEEKYLRNKFHSNDKKRGERNFVVQWTWWWDKNYLRDFCVRFFSSLIFHFYTNKIRIRFSGLEISRNNLLSSKKSSCSCSLKEVTNLRCCYVIHFHQTNHSNNNIKRTRRKSQQRTEKKFSSSSFFH